MDAQISPRLAYSREDLMASHDYARPNEAAGYALHGGFDAAGTYISPRVLHRWPAVQAWGAALEAAGWPLIDATTTLLKLPNYPTVEQERVLLANGLGQGLWDSLTVTGIIEARGRALVDLVAPDMGSLIVEDISQTATGHLAAGLLAAHGMDEGGGDPRTPEQGAHDAMWFAARDMVFGANAYPLPEVPESISRPVTVEREMPQIAPQYEALIKMMMNVLMIEVRAESFFAFCCAVFRDPANFKDRRASAEQAAVIVERIRTDEAIHVAYLQVVISELRRFQLRTVEGQTVPGHTLIDPIWSDMVEWHGNLEREMSKARSRTAIEARAIARLGAEQATLVMAQIDQL